MSDKELTYIEGIGWRYETEHSMHRRMLDHDYQSRCIYMLTLSVEGRRPLLGRLHWTAEDASDATVEPTPLGVEVERCWRAIPDHYPAVTLLAFQLMPDHIHGLLFVHHDQEAHLGQMVNGFKVGCNRAYRHLVESPEAVPARQLVESPEAVPQGTRRAPQPAPQPTAQGGQRPKHSSTGLLFEPGYQDSVLKGKDQLEHMFRYIADNPRRLAIKRMNPDLFRVVSNLTAGGQTFAAIGNRWLLDRPIRMQVRCHNNTTPENLRLIANQKAYFLDRAEKGGVVVCPCISTGEKEIARAALDARKPLVVILENGFPPMYKPPGQYFDACAEGRLLMLSPWPYHMERRTITRSQCLALNQMARDLSSEPWTDELEHSLK